LGRFSEIALEYSFELRSGNVLRLWQAISFRRR
jgi:hypothetical protein